MRSNQSLITITMIAILLAFSVIGLGAYTRLKDAGLGCPDWPGCYGQLIAPSTAEKQEQATQAFPNTTIDVTKAQTEMAHRYLAGTLGLFILVISMLTLKNWNRPQQPKLLPLLLIGIVIFQGLLGMWTVTLKLLPIVVMGHLLGGILTLSLLWCLFLQYRSANKIALPATRLSRFSAFALLILFLQIALGGWTSTNYAALACPDFPMCQHQWLPPLNVQEAFRLIPPMYKNSYEFGVLDNTARVTIHLFHRLGAFITSLILIFLATALLQSASARLQKLATLLISLIILQVSLGITNVMSHLPLPIAVAHNVTAASLLLCVITIHFYLHYSPKSQASAL